MFSTILLLALHGGSTYQVPSKLPNGSGGQGQPGVVIIPTIDGETPLANHDGAKVHISELAGGETCFKLYNHQLIKYIYFVLLFIVSYF